MFTDLFCLPKYRLQEYSLPFFFPVMVKKGGVTLCVLLDLTVCTVTLGEPLGCLPVSSAVKLIS